MKKIVRLIFGRPIVLPRKIGIYIVIDSIIIIVLSVEKHCNVRNEIPPSDIARQVFKRFRKTIVTKFRKEDIFLRHMYINKYISMYMDRTYVRNET